MEGCAEVTGYGCLEVERFPCYRMMESQPESMQTHAVTGVVLVTILAVTNHWVPDVRHVDADLVLASREQVQEQQ